MKKRSRKNTEPIGLKVAMFQPGPQHCRVTISQYVSNGITRTGYRNYFIMDGFSHLEVQAAIEFALVKLALKAKKG
jgi:hypothetical protein